MASWSGPIGRFWTSPGAGPATNRAVRADAHAITPALRTSHAMLAIVGWVAAKATAWLDPCRHSNSSLRGTSNPGTILPVRKGGEVDAVTIGYGLACILGAAFVRGYSGFGFSL